MARAAANPQAKNLGTNIVGIVAEQKKYDERVELPTTIVDSNGDLDPSVLGETAIKGKLNKNLVEFAAPYGLTPVKQFYPVQRLKGNPSPDPSIPGMEMGGGQMNFYFDPTSAGFWLKHLLQLTTEVTKIFGLFADTRTLSIPAGTASTFGNFLPIGADKQPKDILAESSNTFTKPNVASKDVTQARPEEMIASRLRITGSLSTVEIKVRGKDQNGTVIEEVLDTGAATRTTKKYFATDVEFAAKSAAAVSLTEVAYVLSEWDATNSVDVGVHEHTLKPVSTVSEGLTLEVQEGNINTPILYTGSLVSRGIIRLAPVAMAQFLITSNRVFPRTALDGGEDGTVPDPFTRLDFDAVPNCGFLWEIDGADLPSDMVGSYRIAQLGVAIDNALAPPSTAFANQKHYPKLVRMRNREMQTQVIVDHSKDADFDSLVDCLHFKNTVSAISTCYGGPYRAVRMEMNSQFTGYPRRQVNQLGEVTVALTLRANIDSAANDELTITVINTESDLGLL